MAIHKPPNFIEVYRVKASAKDINELTGRAGRPDLTQFVSRQIISKLQFHRTSRIVDIGCGDALFLQLAAERVDRGRLIGILPTSEEVSRVRQHLLGVDPGGRISIKIGQLHDVRLPVDFADIIVSNSTFLILQTLDNVKAALNEIGRIAKVGAQVFIGELPAIDEMAGKGYGDSISGWLWWILKNQGMKQFGVRLKQLLPAVVGSEPFIIAPKKSFFMEPQPFIELLTSHGFQTMEYYKHKEIDLEGNIHESRTRWDFLAYKR